MDTAVFEELGLTPAEIKVYLALLELGSTRAGPVLEKTGLQNSVVHLTLRKLAEKGYVSYVRIGKVKHYQATDPSNILRFLDEQKHRFEAVLPQLLARQRPAERQEAEIFEGFRGFKAALFRMLDEARPGDEWLFFNFYAKHPEEFRHVYQFYKHFDEDRVARGVRIKGIAPSNVREYNGNRKAEIVFVDEPIPLNMTIFRDFVLLTPWEERPLCFLIRSRQLAESFRQYFYAMWNREKAKLAEKNR